MTLVIHIGMQKTGTTFLQQALTTNRAKLVERGLLYPSPAAGLPAGGGSAHHFLAHALLGWRVKYTPEGSFDLLADHAAALHALLADHPGTSVISSEDFSRLNDKQVKALRALFPGDDVRILVYLRRQDLWLDALYGQALKIGQQLDMDSFIARSRARLNYRRLLQRWGRAFGKRNLIVRPYEGFERGGLWQDFCTALDCPDAAALLIPETQVNVSLSHESSIFLAGITDGDWRHRLRILLEKGEAASRRRPVLRHLDPALARALLAEHAEDNACIARCYLNRDQLFEDTRPRAAHRRFSPLLRHALVARHLLCGALASGRVSRRDLHND